MTDISPHDRPLRKTGLIQGASSGPSIFDRSLIVPVRSGRRSAKLDPRTLVKRPGHVRVEIVSVLTTNLFLRDLIVASVLWSAPMAFVSVNITYGGGLPVVLFAQFRKPVRRGA